VIPQRLRAEKSSYRHDQRVAPSSLPRPVVVQLGHGPSGVARRVKRLSIQFALSATQPNSTRRPEVRVEQLPRHLAVLDAVAESYLRRREPRRIHEAIKVALQVDDRLAKKALTQ
jgi:hypothetical protein